MDYASRLFQVESGGDPNAVTPSGTYKGLAQLSPSEEAQYGINSQNRTDPAAQRAAALGIQQANAPILQSKLGRPSSPGEDYLAHQQGATGASALLTGGDTPAWQAIRPYYKSDAMAQMAISGNLPKNSGLTVNSPASSFSKYWVNKFEQTPQGALSPANQGAPVADPNTPGALSTQQLYGQGALQNGGQPPPNALGSGGVGDTLQGVGSWLQSANNPGGAAALLEQAGARRKQELALQQQFMPQVLDGGTDPLTNQKSYLSYDPRTGTMRPIGGAPGAQGPAGTPAQGMGAIRQALNSGVTGEDLLKYVPPEYQTYLQALKDGRAIPGNMGRGGTARQGLMTLAQTIYGPEMDETNIEARQKMAKSMASTSPNDLGGQLQSANTLMNHNALLSADIDNLEKLGVTGKSAMWNSVKQFAADKVPGMIDQPVQAALASFDKHKQAVASELTRLTRGSNGSMQEVQDWKNGMNGADSIAALRSSTAATVDLMHGRVQAGIDNYNKVMNKNVPVENYLSAPAKASIDKIAGGAAQYAPPGAAPAQVQPQQAPGAPPSKLSPQDVQQSLSNAKAAIAAGKPRAAVIQRLQQSGIDPGGL
jgi:hypothetical protein